MRWLGTGELAGSTEHGNKEEDSMNSADSDDEMDRNRSPVAPAQSGLYAHVSFSPRLHTSAHEYSYTSA